MTAIGWKHSPETIAKMKQQRKGLPSHRKGKKLSEETRHRMSIARLGYHPTEEIKQRMRKPKSEEHRRALSLGMQGRKLSDEHKNKIRIARTGQIPWNKGLPAWNRGKHSKDYSLRKLIRMSEAYRHWRFSILKRDGFQCVLCFAKGYSAKLQVDHHPKSFAQIIKDNNIQSMEQAMACAELWNTSANRTLCLSCHEKTPNYFNHNHRKKNAGL